MHRSTHQLDQFLEQGEGLMGLALATPDAELAHTELCQRGFNPQDVKNLTRNFELSSGAVQPRFQLCFLSDVETHGLMSVVFCQHLTPELLRKPEWLTHQNGAQGVSSVTCVVPDLEVAQQTQERLFGAETVECDNTELHVHVAQHHSIRMLNRQGFRREYGSLSDASWPREKFIAAVALAVADLPVCEALLKERDVHHTKSGDHTIRVAPQEACGVILEFVESTNE